MATRWLGLKDVWRRNPVFGFASIAFGITGALIAYKYIIDPRLRNRRFRESEKFAHILMEEDKEKFDG